MSALTWIVPSARAAAPADGWRIRLSAQMPGVQDQARITVGACAACAMGWDLNDVPHPPAFPDHSLDLVTRHEVRDSGWNAQPEGSLDYQAQYDAPLIAISRTIELHLRSRQAGSATLLWSIEPDLSLSGYYLRLVDPQTGINMDLWTPGSLALPVSSGDRLLKLEIIPGRQVTPVAYSQTIAVSENVPAAVTLLAQDPSGQALTYSVATLPAHGQLTGTAPNLIYTPAPGYLGTDSFTFSAQAGGLQSNLAVVTLQISRPNHPPVAFEQSIRTARNAAVNITLTADDPDGDALRLWVSEAPAHGTLNGSAPNITYTPDAGYSGNDSFVFMANDGRLDSNAATITVLVNEPPVAAITVPGPAHAAAGWTNNVSSSADGALVVSATSQGVSNPASAIIDPAATAPWLSASGQIANQSIIIQLAGGIRKFDKIRIQNPTANLGYSVRHFTLHVSTTNTTASAFTEVLADTATETSGIQEFALSAPVTAKFVKFTALDNYGSTAGVGLLKFEAVDSSLSGIPSYFAHPANLAALKSGGRIVSASSEDTVNSYYAKNLLDGSQSTMWQSANSQPANQAIIVELSNGKVFSVDRIKLANYIYISPVAVKNFKVFVSATSTAEDAFVEVYSGMAQNLNVLQEFVFPNGAVNARYVKFLAVDNYGSTTNVAFSELQVIPVATSATSLSSYQQGNTGRAENLLDGLSTTYWQTATGAVANQWVKIRVSEADPLIDRIKLMSSPNSDSLKDFSVFISSSTDQDAAFSLVMNGTLDQDGILHEFSFPGGAVRAKYVKLLAKNNYGSTDRILISTFEPVTVESYGNIITLPGTLRELAKNGSPSQAVNGASVTGYSSAANGATTPAEFLKYYSANPWITTSTTAQYATIKLGGTDPHLLRGVVVSGNLSGATSDSLKDFEVWVSSTTDTPDAFTKVLGAAAPNDLKVHEYLFVGGEVSARFVKLVPLTTHGVASAFRIGAFDVIADAAGRLSQATSTDASYTLSRPELVLDGNSATKWQSAAGQAAYQSLRVMLPGPGVRPVIGVRIWPYGGLGPRTFEVRAAVSDAASATFSLAHQGTASSSDSSAVYYFNRPVDARQIEFLWVNGYSSTAIAVRELQVIEAPADGAVVLAYSSASSGLALPANALDFDNSGAGWTTASGSAVNQWFKVALPQPQAWLIDQLIMEPSVGSAGSVVRDFDLMVSTTTGEDSAFTTVYSGRMKNSGQRQSFHFPQIPARYVKLLAKNSYSATSISIGAFWVISPQIGAVGSRFLDASSDGNGDALVYDWQFGDGAGSPARDALHQFPGPGLYNLSQTVTDVSGDASTRAFTYRVYGGPEVDFSAAPVVPGEMQQTTFTDLSTDPNGPIAYREWSWGDGSSATLATSPTNHAYLDNGLFPVTLTSWNRRGIPTALTRPLTVANLPPIATAGTDKSVFWGQSWNTDPNVNDPSGIDATSLRCQWDYNDGQSLQIYPCNVNNVRTAHAFADPGVYAPQLTVTDKDAGVAVDLATITVLKHATRIALCAPPVLSSEPTYEQEITATLLNTSVPGISMAGKTLRISVGGHTHDITTDANGIGRLRITLTSGIAVPIDVIYDGDAHYLGSTTATSGWLGIRNVNTNMDNRGTDFWLAFPTNNDVWSIVDHKFFVSAPRDTAGTITIPGLNFCESFKVTAGVATTLSLPPAVMLLTADGIEAKAIHISTIDDVTAYGLSRYPHSTDAYLALPTQTLGTSHIVQAYLDTYVRGSQFAVVAAQDGTSVTITPAATVGARTAGVPFTINLNQGQTYQLRSNGADRIDLSGTFVTSSKPVALFGGHLCTRVPFENTEACDHLVEQLPDTRTWGKRFVTVPLKRRVNGDTMRVMAAENGTKVWINGALVATLNRGQFHQQQLAVTALITADHPVLVAQYATSQLYGGGPADPFMMLVPPTEQFLSDYILSVPMVIYPYNTINITIPTAAVESFRLDGQAVATSNFSAIGASGYSGAQLDVSEGSHQLSAALPFGAFVYGFATTESYGYPGGMALKSIAALTSLSVNPLTEDLEVGQAGCIAAALTGQNGAPLQEIQITFSVSGSNSSSGVALTDSTGRAQFCYTATTAGTDTITATTGSLSASASKKWSIPNHVPVASDQTLTLSQDGALSITLTATDSDGDSLSYLIAAAPAHGTLSGTAPALTYTPTAGYVGTDSFTFRANDGHVDSNLATVSLTITPVNHAPAAIGQSLTTTEENSVTATLSGLDPDGDALAYAVTLNPAHGTLSGIAPNLTYTPAANYSGSDSFTFVVSDGVITSVPATVSITVTATNDAPTADAQAVETDEDAPVAITLAGQDADGDALTYTVSVLPLHGTLSGSGAAQTYTPDADYFGPDSFEFTANDGTVDSAHATVTITVRSLNDAPTAQGDSLTTNEDQPLALQLRAGDADGDLLNYLIVTAPTHGALSGTAPDLVYTPDANYSGPDSFVFKVSDGQAESALATVSITVAPVNDAPTAQNLNVTVAEDASTAVTIAGTDPDGDALSYAVVASPAHGTLSGTAPNLTYTPAPDYTGPDAFTFKANDGALDSNVATVAITVTPVNDTPVAFAQSVTTAEDAAVAITLNGADPEGDALTYALTSAPAHGTLSGTAPNLTYTPAANYHGPDGFSFTVSDGVATSAAATVAITVTPVNDAPTAQDLTVTTPQETAVGVTLLGSDLDGDTLSFSVLAQPAHGVLSGSGATLTYTPFSGYWGPDSFTYVANDGITNSAPATVSITVEHVNRPPSAADLTLSTNYQTPVAADLVASDPDGDALTYLIVTPPQHGTLTGTAPSLTYTPATGYSGPDSFTFKVSDGSLDSSVATVSITVRPPTGGNVDPDCDHASASPATLLWAPRHDLKPVSITGVTDSDGDSVTLSVTEVYQDEPVQGNGDGNTTPDATLSPLKVRAERAGTGDGRVYHLRFTADDGRGGQCTGEVTVCVPHDQSLFDTCVDGGARFDSTRQ